jgi:hypothetical protein
MKWCDLWLPYPPRGVQPSPYPQAYIPPTDRLGQKNSRVVVCINSARKRLHALYSGVKMAVMHPFCQARFSWIITKYLELLYPAVLTAEARCDEMITGHCVLLPFCQARFKLNLYRM